MPVNVSFNDDKRYLVYDITDPIEISDLMEAYKQEKAMRDSVAYTLHSIVDMSQVKRIPPNWLTAKAGPGFTHPRRGMILFVGISSGLQIILRTILNVVRYKRIKFFSTRDEAEAYMQTLLADEPASSNQETDVG